MVELLPGPFRPFPATSPESDAALEAAIRQNFLDVPIYLDERRQILDGHRRYAIYQRLGIRTFTVRTISTVGLSDEEVRRLVLTLNVNRRHLVRRADKWEAIDAYLAVDPEVSSRQLADHLGCSHNTVEARRRRTGQVAQQRKGKDGRVRRVPMVESRNAKEFNEVQRDLTELDGRHDVHSRKQLTKRAVKSKRAKKAEAGGHLSLPAGITLSHQDVTELVLPSESAEMFLVDPPWAPDQLHLYDHAGRLASQALVPGGLLLAWCGPMILPQVLHHLGQHLSYVFEFIVAYENPSTRTTMGMIRPRHTCLLAFSKGKPRLPVKAPLDLFTCERGGRAAAKADHDWAADFGAAHYYLSHLCHPGDRIVDLFAGGGTFARVVHQLGQGRQYTGYDLDEQCLAITRASLAGEVA